MKTRGRIMLLGAIGLALVGGYEAVHLWLYDTLTPPLLAPMDPAQGVGSLSATTCGSCHVTIAAEWRESRHAQAATDPLYVADLAAQDTPYFCDHCHAPLIEQRAVTTSGLWRAWPTLTPRSEENPRHIAGLRHEGVTCVACHQRDGAMMGPFASAIAPHPVTQTDLLGTEEGCRPCHVLDLQSVGDLERPIMDTFAEWEAYRAAGGDKTCVDCHMPALADRPAARGAEPRPATSHALRGPFDLAFVREGAQVVEPRLAQTADGGLSASLTLVNGTGHHLPTAEPHRKLVATLELLDARGEVLAKDRHLVQRIVDLHTLSEQPGEDTSLTPREQRPVSLSLPAPLSAEARAARLVVRFILWDPSDAIAVASGLGADTLIHTLFERTLTLASSRGE